MEGKGGGGKMIYAPVRQKPLRRHWSLYISAELLTRDLTRDWTVDSHEPCFSDTEKCTLYRFSVSLMHHIH